MKIKFVLKAKDLNKKWLKSVKSLYGKQKLVISIEPDNGEEMDLDFDDDSWWDGDEEEFALEIDNTVDNDFNAEEYLASIEKQMVVEIAKEVEEKPEETIAEAPVKQKRKWERKIPAAEKPAKEKKTKDKTVQEVVETPAEEALVKVKGKGGRPKKVVETPVVETLVEEAPVKVKGKGGRPKKVVETPVARIEETEVSSDTTEN